MEFWLTVNGNELVIERGNRGRRALKLTREDIAWVFWWIGAIRPFATPQELSRIECCADSARNYAKYNPDVRETLSCAHMLVRYPWGHSLAAAPIALHIPARYRLLNIGEQPGYYVWRHSVRDRRHSWPIVEVSAIPCTRSGDDLDLFQKI